MARKLGQPCPTPCARTWQPSSPHRTSSSSSAVRVPEPSCDTHSGRSEGNRAVLSHRANTWCIAPPGRSFWGEQPRVRQPSHCPHSRATCHACCGARVLPHTPARAPLTKPSCSVRRPPVEHSPCRWRGTPAPPKRPTRLTRTSVWVCVWVGGVGVCGWVCGWVCGCVGGWWWWWWGGGVGGGGGRAGSGSTLCVRRACRYVAASARRRCLGCHVTPRARLVPTLLQSISAATHSVKVMDPSSVIASCPSSCRASAELTV